MNLGVRAIAAIVAAVVLLILLVSSLFTVNEREQALVLRFGQIQGTARVEEGLHFKAPFIDTAFYLPKLILPLDLPPQEVIAAGQERLVVDAFARYRISNPTQFYQAVGSVAVADSRLGTVLNSAVRRVLGRSSFEDIVRDDRDALMQRIEAQVAGQMARDFGIEIVDVRLRRADLPPQNSERVFDRMRAQRVQEATQIRAQGNEAARRIEANAQRQATVIVADAERDSQRVRGEGDATRNAIFAEAFSQDPDFFAFYRSMQAYEAALRGQGTRMVLSPDSDFFRYFNDLNGGFERSERTGGVGQSGLAPFTPPSPASLSETAPAADVAPVRETVPIQETDGAELSAETVIEAGGVAGDDEARPEVERGGAALIDEIRDAVAADEAASEEATRQNAPLEGAATGGTLLDTGTSGTVTTTVPLTTAPSATVPSATVPATAQ